MNTWTVLVTLKDGKSITFGIGSLLALNDQLRVMLDRAFPNGRADIKTIELKSK